MQHRPQISQVISITSLILVLVSTSLTDGKVQALRVDIPKSIDVGGAVRKPSRYVIENGDTITIPKALQLAGGLTLSWSDARAAIIRHENGSTIFVELIRLLVTKRPEITLRPGDSLVVERIVIFDTPLPDPNRRTSTTIS